MFCMCVSTLTNSKVFQTAPLGFFNYWKKYVISWLLFHLQMFFPSNFCHHGTAYQRILLSWLFLLCDRTYTHLCCPREFPLRLIVVLVLYCSYDHSDYPVNLITISLVLKIFTDLKYTVQSQLSWPKRFLLVLFWVLFDTVCNFRGVSVSCFMLHRNFSSPLPQTLQEPLTTCCVVPWTTSSWGVLSLHFEKNYIEGIRQNAILSVIFQSYCTLATS